MKLENTNKNVIEIKKDIIKNENNNCILQNIVQDSKEEVWKLEIPKIGLIAEIREGTSEENLNSYIGHFEETQKEKGNIGLAAHNRGYRVNYFNRLKELEIGDEIIYTYSGVSKFYEVISKSIITDTNWEVLENTTDNRLTLITCMENQPTNRRCVQAIEKKMKENDSGYREIQIKT